MQKAFRLKFALTLSLILALILMTACVGGGDARDNANDTASTNQTDPPQTESDNTESTESTMLILPSQLINSDDVEQILDIVLIPGEEEVDVVLDSEPGGLNSIHSLYFSEEYIFQIHLYQDALLEGLAAENGGMAAWIQSVIDSREENYFDQEIIPVDGIGDGGYLVDQTGEGFWGIELWYDNYLVNLTIAYSSPIAHSRNADTENEWRKAVLLEAGGFAIERLKALVG